MFKSVQEINKVYSDHLDSLRVSGLEFSEDEVCSEWAAARADFLERQK